MDERLEDVLEHCRQRLARGESIEQCLAAYPAHRAQLRHLLPLVASLRAIAAPPDPAYVRAARQRFHGHLLVEQRKREAADRTPAPLRWLRRVAIPLAAVVALGGSGAGLVTASADALPDSPLFPIQQAKEQVVQHLARTPEQQVAYQVGLATRRFQQLQRAEALHKSPMVIDALTASMLQATSRAATDLQAVPEPQRQRILVQVAPLLAAEERVLSAERPPQMGAAPATLESRRQQLLAAEQRLRAVEKLPTTPRQSATRRPGATAQPAATPRPTGKNHLVNAIATRTARLRHALGNSEGQAPPPVHTAMP